MISTHGIIMSTKDKGSKKMAVVTELLNHIPPYCGIWGTMIRVGMCTIKVWELLVKEYAATLWFHPSCKNTLNIPRFS